MSLAFRNEIDIRVALAGDVIADVAIRPRSRPPLTRLFAGKPAASLLSAQDESLEASIWAAIRVFDQRANVLTTLAGKDRAASRSRSADHHDKLADEAREHAKALRRFLMKSGD